MNKQISAAVTLILLSISGLRADEVMVRPAIEEGVAWYNTADWQPDGQAWTNGINHYVRFPDWAKDKLTDGYLRYGRNSAGLFFRFKTDARTIHVRFKLSSPQLAMEHMPATGVSGLDLYSRGENGKWLWTGMNYPLKQEDTSELVSDLPGKMTEFIMFLPLYNGIEYLKIGVPKDSAFIALTPDKRKPVLQYGGSIDHGGCASRSGMSYSAILSRRLDRTFLNFGFSGSACLEPGIAELFAGLDPALFIIGSLNATTEIVNERGIRFIEILREKHPETPIVILENYPILNTWTRPHAQAEYKRKAQSVRAVYDHFAALGDKNIYLIPTDACVCGENIDFDGAVDGIHPNDLGMERYANAFEKVIRPILQKSGK